MVLHVRRHLPGRGSTQDNSQPVHGLTPCTGSACWYHAGGDDGYFQLEPFIMLTSAF
jgi:hypothetical protein